MRPSRLETSIRRTRRLMDEQDAAVRARMVSTYADAIEGLNASLAKLATIPVDEMTQGQLIADSRYRQLLTEAEAGFSRFADDAQEILLRAQRNAARIGADRAVPMMQSAAPDVLAASFTRLPEAALQELVGTIGPGSPVRAVLDGYGSDAAQTIESEFVRGIARGENSRTIAGRILEKIGGDSWRVEMLARTETQRPFRTAALQTYARHGHILDGWRWSAALQPRTCLACLSLDGRVFPLSVQFMGNHPSCRCSPSPFRRNGPSQYLETGEQWFLAQDESTRRQMLPRGAWDPFAAGDLTLSDFVQRDEDPIWGTTYRESSLTTALERADRRQIRRVA